MSLNESFLQLKNTIQNKQENLKKMLKSYKSLENIYLDKRRVIVNLQRLTALHSENMSDVTLLLKNLPGKAMNYFLSLEEKAKKIAELKIEIACLEEKATEFQEATKAYRQNELKVNVNEPKPTQHGLLEIDFEIV